MARRRRVFIVRHAHRHAAFSASPAPLRCPTVLRPAPRGSRIEPREPRCLPPHASLSHLSHGACRSSTLSCYIDPQGSRHRPPVAAAWCPASLPTLPRPRPPRPRPLGRLRTRSVLPRCMCGPRPWRRLLAFGAVCTSCGGSAGPSAAVGRVYAPRGPHSCRKPGRKSL